MKRIVSLRLFLMALIIPLSAGSYKIFPFSFQYNVAAINASGQVAGTGGNVAFLWTRAGSYQFLGSLGGGTSFAAAINDSGAIAGQSTLSNGTTHAFLWTQSGGMQDLGSPLGGISFATTVNAAGEVAGVTEAPGGGTIHAFFWSQATGAVDIGTLNGNPISYVSGLNNSGEVAGTSQVSGTSYSAFRWTLSGGIQALPGFGGSASAPSALNDSGQIVGFSSYPDGTQHAALWALDGSIHDLGALSGDTNSYAILINAAGHIAGYSGYQFRHQFIRRTFFWTPEAGMIDIGGGAGPNRFPSGLNTRDQILGHGAETYLWSPTLGLQAITSGTVHALQGAFNDAGQFLATQSGTGKLFTPIMQVSLSSSQNPSVQGQSVTFTANVSAIVGLPPDGEQVSFHDGGSVIGTGALSNGTASFTTSILKVGTHNIFARYAGDSNYYASSSAKLAQVVNP